MKKTQRLSADLEQAWLRHKDKKCVRAAALRLSEDFIKEHEEAMGELDYKSVCGRLAKDVDYVIDKSRLTTEDYCFVIARNHRHISDQEADQLLFGHIKELLFRGDYPWRYIDLTGPTLFLYKPVRYIIWALGQTGNASTIIKFHLWNKTLQENLPNNSLENTESLLDDFANLAWHTIPVKLPENDKMKSKRIIGSKLLLPEEDMDVEIPNPDDEFASIPF